MFHIHILHRRTARFSSREARLICVNGPEYLSQAFETVVASKDIADNPVLKQSLEIYNTALTTRFPHLNKPHHQAALFALLLNGMLPDTRAARMAGMGLAGVPGGPMMPPLMPGFGRPEYAKVKRSPEVRFADPFNIQKDLNEDERKQVDATQSAWQDGSSVGLSQEVIDRNIRKYEEWSAELDRILSENRILPPDTRSANGTTDFELLSRNETFDLLVLISQGKAGEIEEAAKQNGLAGLRGYISNPALAPGLTRANIIHTDVTIDTAGSPETLSRFGIVLGPYLHEDYLRQRREQPGSVQFASGAIATEPTVNAALWRREPMLAHAFLASTAFPNLPANRAFLEDLAFYFDTTRPKDPAYRPHMAKKDVETILGLIIENCLSFDDLAARSVEKLEGMRTELNFAQKVEKTSHEVWEFIKDYQDHKVASIAIGIGAFMAVRTLYGLFFKKDVSRFTRIVALTTFGGLAWGMYQQQKGGKAFWEDLLLKIDYFKNKELGRRTSDHSTNGVWAEILQLDKREKDCLAILEKEPIDAVLDWYQRYDNARPAGSVQLPFSTSKYQHLFGEMPPKDVQEAFYQALKKFFANRGKAVKAGGWWIMGKDDARGDDSIGLDYIRQMYVERRHFSTILTRVVGPIDIVIDGKNKDLLYDWGDPNVQLYLRQRLGPDLYFRLCVFHYLYTQEQQLKTTGNWPMFYVFAFEMDSGMLSRLGKNNPGLASVLDQVARQGRVMGVSAARGTVDLLQAGWKRLASNANIWGLDYFGQQLMLIFNSMGDATIEYLGEKYKWANDKWESLTSPGKVLPAPPPPPAPGAAAGGLPPVAEGGAVVPEAPGAAVPSVMEGNAVMVPVGDSGAFRITADTAAKVRISDPVVSLFVLKGNAIMEDAEGGAHVLSVSPNTELILAPGGASVLALDTNASVSSAQPDVWRVAASAIAKVGVTRNDAQIFNVSGSAAVAPLANGQGRLITAESGAVVGVLSPDVSVGLFSGKATVAAAEAGAYTLTSTEKAEILVAHPNPTVPSTPGVAVRKTADGKASMITLEPNVNVRIALP